MKVRKFRERIVENKNSYKCQIGPVIGSRGRIPLKMNGFQNKLSTNFTFTAKIHIISRCIPCQAINCTWSYIRNFPQTRQNQRLSRVNFTFTRLITNGRSQTGNMWCSRVQLMMHSCRYRPLEAPIFWFPSGYVYLRTGVATVLGFRTYIYVRKSERVK